MKDLFKVTVKNFLSDERNNIKIIKKAKKND